MKTSWFIKAYLAGNSIYIVQLVKESKNTALYIGKSRRQAFEACRKAREYAKYFDIKLGMEDIDLPEREIYE